MITFICVCGLSEVNGYACDGGGSGINFPFEGRGGACGRVCLLHLSICIFVNLLLLGSEV